MMDARTLKALHGSIKKWEAIAKGTGTDKSGENCPLCQEFAYPSGKPFCHDCPVKQKVK